MSPTVLSYVGKVLDSLLMSYSGGVQRAREGPVEECPRNDSRVNEMVIVPLASRPVPVVVSSSSMSGPFFLQQQMRGWGEREDEERVSERGQEKTGQDRTGLGAGVSNDSLFQVVPFYFQRIPGLSRL